MTQPKKLIEVAMPVKEISAECLRDDRIQHGHISSLHKWWARRPLPVCRAVVFASLVPDPSHASCPVAFKDAVELLLGQPLALDTKPGYEDFKKDHYKPYEDIPYTASRDLMVDNLRNRLLMFIGKFSDKYSENERKGEVTPPKYQISNASLIKWESRDSESIISIARKLIWVAHNSKNSDQSAEQLLAEFERRYKAIKVAEHELYSLPDRHLQTNEVKLKEKKLEEAIEAFWDGMPKVFDPFAGGGAIPLEAARLGCKSYGNDINPVAHIIQKGSVELPQKFGKPIAYTAQQFRKLYGDDYPQQNVAEIQGGSRLIHIPNRLAFDVEFFVKRILDRCEKKLGHLYPDTPNGRKPFAYYWARTAKCSNPSCRAEVPLLRQFYLAHKENKKIHLSPKIVGNKIEFSITTGLTDTPGWINRGNLICPCCGSITDVKELKRQSKEGGLSQRLLAVITEDKKGKHYHIPSEREIEIVTKWDFDTDVPTEKMQRNSAGGDTFGWGITKWGQLFSPRQLHILSSIVQEINQLKLELESFEIGYRNAIITYLAIWFDRIAARMTQFGLIDLGGEKVVDLFGRQAIPMVFDYPEMNVFRLEQLSWIIKYIKSESNNLPSSIANCASGDKNQFAPKHLDCVITDPPYYDAIAYADLSDFFYIWLKRILSDVYPLNFATPQTPKADECTALKHHHSNNRQLANSHFEDKLLRIFDAIEYQTNGIVAIMFAHQSTQAWSTLCNSILGAKMNITGSWSIKTEKKGGLKEAKAFLSSSVTVACRPTKKSGFMTYREIRDAVYKKVKERVKDLFSLGFRGADLLTACFGQAVSEFGRYERVEKSDGREVEIKELLEMARESAFNILVKDYPADEYTKFFIAWAQLYGFTDADFDDVNRVVKIGLSIETRSLVNQGLLRQNGNRQSLSGYKYRLTERKNTGQDESDPLIDKVHRGMYLFKTNNEKVLLEHISKYANSADNLFWRVLNSLVEILPVDKEHDDKKVASELLANKEALIRKIKQTQQAATQTSLGI